MFRRYQRAYNFRIHSVAEPHAGAGVIFVLDFGFGQRSAVKEAPIDRLAATIDVTFFHEIQERAGDGGLVFMAHRQVGIVPAAENAEALEIFLVLLDVANRELAAQLAEFRRRYFPFAAQFFFHLRLNRQAMAIPARHVRRVVPRHALGLDDQVFQDFVEAGTEMNFARRIRGAVV